MRRSKRLAPRSLALFLLTAAVACGGAEATDLFGGSGITTDGGGGGDPDSASVEDGASSEDAGVGRDGSATKDTGRPGEGDASVPDTSRPKDDPGISCGQGAAGEINCNPTTQYCCGTSSGGSGVNFDCKAVVSPCSGVKIACDDSADCPLNHYCCGTFVQNTGYTKVACSMNPSCGTPTSNTSYVRFCDPGAVPDECAAAGLACNGVSGSIPGYTYCK